MGISYMLDTFAVSRRLSRAEGSVECKIDLILGLPIPAVESAVFPVAVIAAFLHQPSRPQGR